MDHFDVGLAIAGDLHVLADHGIGTQIKRQANDEAEPDLAKNFVAAGEPIFVLAEYLDVIVQEAQGSEPNGRDYHQYHIYIAQTTQQQTGHEDGNNNNDSAH